MKLTTLGLASLLFALACGGAAVDPNTPSTASTSPTTPSTSQAGTPTKTATDSTAGSSNGIGGGNDVSAIAGSPKIPPNPQKIIPAPGPTHTGDPSPRPPPAR